MRTAADAWTAASELGLPVAIKAAYGGGGRGLKVARTLEEIPDVTFADIGGLATQLEALRDAVELPFRHRELFGEFRLRPPKGVLLYGPPGCGKTMIAKAVAESGSTDSAGIIKYWNSLSTYPGYFGNYRFSSTEHNGYLTEEIVMSESSTAKNGTFALAPGYT